MAKSRIVALIVVLMTLSQSVSAYAGAAPIPSSSGITPSTVAPAARKVPLQPRFLAVPPPVKALGRASAVRSVGTDSVPTFNGTYTVPNFDFSGKPNSAWVYNMLGRNPRTSETTVLRAPVIPLVLQFLNPDGSVAATSNPQDKVSPALTSPVFFPQRYSSSTVPTQYADAIQRAEFYTSAREDWHTILIPQVMTPRTMRVPGGQWSKVLTPAGTPFYLVDYTTFTNLLFPATNTDTTTPIGAAEHAGEMTTQDVTTLLVDNVALQGSFGCCVLGYHSYDLEPGDRRNGNRERDYVVNFSSWISGGLFGDAFTDVTALSHEIAETFNDPFVSSQPATAAIPYDETPWWLAPNGVCQANLEVGDVIEGLPKGTYTTTILGRTYHPQNEALLQWFESKTPSDAIGGAYSYPDTSVLTSANVPQNPGCA